MSDFHHFDYAPPRSWEQFEELCADLFQTLWNDPAAVRHGRAGQRQHGVDIIARQGSRYPIGIQCKRKSRWPVKKLTKTDVDDEVAEALGFSPALKVFYIVTTAEEDATLQAHVRKVNEKHKTQGDFEVVLLGWSELVRRITLQRNVAAKHFGAVGGSAPEPLLKTWFSSNGILEVDETAFELEVRELELDLNDWPSGRLVIRQRESDALLQKLRNYENRQLNDAQRRDRIKLRQQLRRLVSDEERAARHILRVMNEDTLSSYVCKAWEEDTPQILRAYIQTSLDQESFIVGAGTIELRIFPPDNDQRILLHYPSDLYQDISALMEGRREMFGKPIMANVGDLPPSVRARHAVPAVLRRIMHKWDEGVSLETLRARQWLEMAFWRVEI
ncbi:restriction endonuclease [Delftia sp. CH05]|uniref:restriction endonuclease n=1 Tax=Delftia sp. CH05 TaxID=2692194 RepID=UPI00135EB54B|nr:restriction endonuclease [Delftia sp. CH05]MXN30117.1 hypothetical protein [Delftia sp. CH05]